MQIWDATASDPKLLVFLKSYRNTVPVPRHWSQKRKYLQVGKCNWYAFYLLNYECINLGLLLCELGDRLGLITVDEVLSYTYICDSCRVTAVTYMEDKRVGTWGTLSNIEWVLYYVSGCVGWDVEYDWYKIKSFKMLSYKIALCLCPQTTLTFMVFFFSCQCYVFYLVSDASPQLSHA